MQTKKEAILDSVLDILSNPDTKKKLTISNIAKTLDIGKSTVYEYFTHKEQMIEEAIMLMINRNETLLLNIHDFEALTFKEAFYKHIKQGFAMTSQNQMAQHLTQNVEYASISNEAKMRIMNHVLSLYKKARKQMQSVYQKGIDEGVLVPPVTPERMRSIEALTFGTFVAANNPINNWTYEMIIDDLYVSVCSLYNNKKSSD
ncbi:MAG: TetR/AcrR family transcriptional regulator [Bacillota bacterium]